MKSIEIKVRMRLLNDNLYEIYSMVFWKKYEIIFLFYVVYKIENVKNMIIFLFKNMEKYVNINDKMIIFWYIYC